jgi:ribosomal protein L34E
MGRLRSGGTVVAIATPRQGRDDHARRRQRELRGVRQKCDRESARGGLRKSKRRRERPVGAVDDPELVRDEIAKRRANEMDAVGNERPLDAREAAHGAEQQPILRHLRRPPERANGHRAPRDLGRWPAPDGIRR